MGLELGVSRFCEKSMFVSHHYSQVYSDPKSVICDGVPDMYQKVSSNYRLSFSAMQSNQSRCGEQICSWGILLHSGSSWSAAWLDLQ